MVAAAAVALEQRVRAEPVRQLTVLLLRLVFSFAVGRN